MPLSGWQDHVAVCWFHFWIWPVAVHEESEMFEPATVTPLENDRARVRLHNPQPAVTPGQAAVIYDGDIVLGGGWICRGVLSRHPEHSDAAIA